MVKKIQTDMIAEIDLNETGVYFVSDGALTKVNPIQYGEINIKFQNGKVFEAEKREKIRSLGQSVV